MKWRNSQIESGFEKVVRISNLADLFEELLYFILVGRFARYSPMNICRIKLKYHILCYGGRNVQTYWLLWLQYISLRIVLFMNTFFFVRIHLYFNHFRYIIIYEYQYYYIRTHIIIIIHFCIIIIIHYSLCIILIIIIHYIIIIHHSFCLWIWSESVYMI
jgi:hypothetical protein